MADCVTKHNRALCLERLVEAVSGSAGTLAQATVLYFWTIARSTWSW